MALFELSDVGFARGERVVLHGISVSIPEGSCSIVGPSGSGKSTLLRLLNRLADPGAGTIAYRGRPLAEHEVLALRREVSLVPQLPALLPGTLAGNLEYAARLAGCDANAERCLGLAGLDEGMAQRDVVQLSVGEQQRAMLARALAQRPRVLLLDEPTSALDEESRDAVEATLQGLRREDGLATVLVTHDIEQARRLSDWALRLQDGRAAACGPCEEVLAA